MPPPVFVQVGNDVVSRSHGIPGQSQNHPSCHRSAGMPVPTSHLPCQSPYFEVYSTGSSGVSHHCFNNFVYEVNQPSFTDKSTRVEFLRKVFGILFVQILFTTGLVALFTLQANVNYYIQVTEWVHYAVGSMFLLDFVAILVLAFQPEWMKNDLASSLVLIFITVCIAVPLAFVAAFFKAQVTLYTTGMNLAVVFLVTLFTFQTKWDLGFCSATLLASVAVSVASLILYYTVPVSPDWEGMSVYYLILAGVMAMLFVMYLVFLVQEMIWQKNNFYNFNLSRTPDEYILASMYLFVGIIVAFLLILSILGGAMRGFGCWGLGYSVPVQRRNSNAV